MTPSPDRPDRYFVLGNPVAHSRSPYIHAEFAHQTGQHLVYERRLCPLDGFAQTVRALAADVEGGRVRGCNVTLPFKFQVAPLVRVLTARAELAEAANTISFDPLGWLGDNTDGIGLVRDIEVNAGVPIRDRRLLLVGAGGAAAGVLGPLIECCPSLLQVINRSPARAVALVERHRPWAEQHGVPLGAGGLEDAYDAFDIVVNASASSLVGDVVPVGAHVLRPGTLALDLMYGPASRGFLDWASAHGASARDGLGMLVEQAAEAFWLWRGVRPHTAPVLESLRAQVQAELRGDGP